MAFLRPKSLLSANERLERRRLILSDTLSLTTLFVITVLLAVVTNGFYQSYASHQAALGRRWLERGQSALQQGHPEAAVNAFRSALALMPGQRSIQMDLAEALASSGRTQEAASYFDNLAESEPGDGMLQLQLARLAARQGETAQAMQDYHRAIYGNWEGDGTIRRREVRLELADFLISRGLDKQARNELLIASGNAPEGDVGVVMGIALRMEKASPGDALEIYKSLLERHPGSVEAMQGAGRVAFQLGRFVEAHRYLGRAVNGPEAATQAGQQSRDLLRDSDRLLLLYPSSQLSAHERGERILADRKIAMARLSSCLASAARNQSNSATGSGSAGTSTAQSGSSNGLHTIPERLQSLARRFAGHASPAASPAPTASRANALEALAERWRSEPPRITVAGLAADPQLAQTELQLIYDTEKVADQVCGPPSGDDALLLKLADAGSAVDQE